MADKTCLVIIQKINPSFFARSINFSKKISVEDLVAVVICDNFEQPNPSKLRSID